MCWRGPASVSLLVVPGVQFRRRRLGKKRNVCIDQDIEPPNLGFAICSAARDWRRVSIWAGNDQVEGFFRLDARNVPRAGGVSYRSANRHLTPANEVIALPELALPEAGANANKKTAPLFKRTLLWRFAWQGASGFSLRTFCPARACGCLCCQLQLLPIAAPSPAPCERNLPSTFATIDVCFHWQSLVSALRSAASTGRAWCRHWTRSCSLGAVAPNPRWCQLASLSTTALAASPLFETRTGPTKLLSVG